MKIALVILHADPARGGAERYTADLARALVSRGHHATLIATSLAPVPGGEGRGEGPSAQTAGSLSPVIRGEGWGEGPNVNGVQSGDSPRRPSPPPSPPSTGEREQGVAHVLLKSDSATRLGRYLRFLDALDAHLQTTTYDIVHAMLPVRRCDVYHPHAGLAAESIASGHMKHRTPLTRWLAQQGNRFNRKRHRFAAVERQSLTGPEAPVVLCLSEYVKATVRKHYTLPEDRLATLFNGTDLARFDPAARSDAGAVVHAKFNIPATQTVALMIAQDFERKGLHEAILALKSNPGVTLLVVGKQATAPYESLAARIGVQGQLVCAGATTDPYAFYRAADFFVLPTRHDPCSLVVLEALAMGVPVISTVFNGACEIMTDGVHGFVLPDPGDIGALANRMQRLTDPEARARMSQACLALRPELSQDHHVDQLLEIYAHNLRR